MTFTKLLSSLNPFSKTRRRKRSKSQQKSRLNKKMKQTKRNLKMRGG